MGCSLSADARKLFPASPTQHRPVGLDDVHLGRLGRRDRRFGRGQRWAGDRAARRHPPAGRVAVCADPWGAVFGLWQAGQNRGAQLVNAPGSWNFSELNVRDTDGAKRFYGAVFGWVCDPLALGAGQTTYMWRVTGYGDFLAQRDPEIRQRQEADAAPEGFADVVALMIPAPSGPADTSAHWSVTFAVADADAAFARALELGARVATPLFDTDYTRMGAIEDPQGAVLTLSEYRPPAPS
jgi:predicted enzyme related to lactoylglutathione lyase